MSKEKVEETVAEAAAGQESADPPAEDAAAGTELESGSETGEESLEIRVARLAEEVRELREQRLRALAEVENIRRRAERDRQEAHLYGASRLARDLLTVYDNLERALAHVDESLRASAKDFIEGVELTRRELLAAFARNNIEIIEPRPGERFDPHLHEAVYEAPIPGAEPGTITEVIQAGFTINGRLLRPARVGVAKAAPATESGTAQGAGKGDPQSGDAGNGEG